MIREVKDKNKFITWYEDDNGNKWCLCTSIQLAEKFSQSLVNCTNCKNCYNCVNCNNCNSCEDCKDCDECTNCNNCTGCKDCTSCNNCHNCEYCEICDNCGDIYCVEYMTKENTANFIAWFKKRNNIDN